MAFLYDQMGNIAGEYESEEERKRREELARTEVSKTEVKTYADGTQEQVVKTQIPAPVRPPVAAGAPAVTSPAVPGQDPLFNNMLRAESGDRQVDPRTGQIMTSPKGALGAAQIMPATAMSPGFGVPNIFDLAASKGINVANRDEATARQLLANESLNREFGQNYANAMRQRFGDQAGVAAYNAGPGAVQRNLDRNQGQFNVAQAPRETQGYLSRVLGPVLNAVIPSAQAGTLTEEQRRREPTITPTAQPAPAPAPTVAAPAPAPAPAPAQQPTGGVNYGLSTGAPASGIGLRPTTFNQPGITTATPATIAQMDEYHALQTNPAGLLKYAYDETKPPQLRERARAQAVEIARQDDEKAKAQAQADEIIARVAAGEPGASRQMGKILSKDDDEGSWLKFLLLGFISPELAGMELGKLGFGGKWEKAYDANGQVVGEIKRRMDGKAIAGTNLDMSPMSKRQLLALEGGTSDRKSFEMPQTLGSPVVKETVDPATGKKTQIGGIRMYDPRTRQTYVQVGKERMPDVDWVTTGQAPGAVYGAGFAREAGSQAAQGYTPPSGPGVSSTTTTPPASGTTTTTPPSTATTPPAGPAVPSTATTPPAGPAVPSTAPASTVPPLTGPAAQKSAAERQGKERDAVLKSNQEFGDALNKARQSGTAQQAVISRLQTAIDRNPAFWGIDTNSTAWRAYVDINSKDADRAEALNTLARNLNVPREKRAEFDQVMNDYRSLQVNAVTGSGLTASQTNTERESQRVMGTVGSLADRPAAAKATLEYAKAKIQYTEAKARAWNEARKKPGADYVDFEIEFDRNEGEKIFAEANKRMEQIIGVQSSPGTGTTSSGNKFRRVQ